MFDRDGQMKEGLEPLDRVRAIERRRALSGFRALGASVGTGYLFFCSFVVGHLLGPSALGPVELVVGASGTLLISLICAGPLARKWRERGALGRFVLHEGRARRRVLIYEDHVLVDEEVVLRAAVEKAVRCDDRVILRYQDPVAKGPLLRELSGPHLALDALVSALAR